MRPRSILLLARYTAMDKNRGMPIELPAKFRPLLSWFEAHRRLAWKPQLKDGDGKLAGSKFAGMPWLAAGEEWPACGDCEGPMRLFLQLDLDDLPQKVGGRFGGGLLQAFFCIQEECLLGHHGSNPFSSCHLIRVVRPSGMNADVAIPRFEDGVEAFPPRQIVGWECVDDYPSLAEKRDLGLDHGPVKNIVICNQPKLEIEAKLKEYFKLPGNVDGEKLAGWAGWVNINTDYPKCPKCETRMDQTIFQLGSNDNMPFMWGDDGQGHIVQCPKHLDVVAFPWTCG